MCALIQYGSIVTGISGKIGGHVYGNSLGGATIKNKSSSRKLWGYIKKTIANGGPSPQGNVSLISQAWKDLTDGERAQWTSYAVQYYTTRSLYGLHSLSGYTCFSKLNHNLLLVGEGLITSPVPKVSLTDLGSVAIPTLTALAFTVSFTGAPTADEKLLISASGSNSITNIPQKKGLKIIQHSAVSAASPISIYGAYSTLKGVPLVGANITVQIEVINILTGQRGNLKRVAHVVL